MENEPVSEGKESRALRSLPRNVWAVSLTSFFMDVSSEMVLRILPLFLSQVLGVRMVFIGLIEGVAESAASLLKIFSGWFSDRLGQRKWLAVAGYGLSALARPLFYVAQGWGMVAAGRWTDRVGKGIRTAPRDALVADSVSAAQRGLAFGFHRAADTAGAALGIGIALAVVWAVGGDGALLSEELFRTLVLISLVPAFLAVLLLALIAREVPAQKRGEMPRLAFFSLGRPFVTFMAIVGLFQLGNSSDAFIVLLARERGVSVVGILGMLLVFNLVYALVSTPAGSLSDRVGRRVLIIGGWLVYAGIYLGFALAQTGAHIWVLYALYGIYYGTAYGTAKALIADIVPAQSRGTAYGMYSAVLGAMDLPASLIAGALWQGVGSWEGLGASAPFAWGAALALVAALLMCWWRPARSQP